MERTTSSRAYRVYRKQDCAVFLKTNEKFGGLSNMAGGYPLFVNDVRILTSEALYQACRFPHLPDVQRLIIEQRSPMTAKMKSKPYRKDSRSDWNAVRVNIMRWCLRVKLVQHWERFGDLLLSTGDCPIVEHSRRDPFWGAKPVDAETLSGLNVLGRLLMELREILRGPEADTLKVVQPPAVSQFLLYDQPIGVVNSAGSAVPMLSSYDGLTMQDNQSPDQVPLSAPVQATLPMREVVEEAFGLPMTTGKA